MENLRSQDEIMASWRGDADRPLVSIFCITYNHEAFIEEALRGFLIQETDFPFEILIHDDASSDRTAAIVRDYHVRYPQLIRPVYQTENQYRQNRKATHILWPLCRGRYIAFCEGDDYWTDPRKLQIQSSYLEAHPEVVVSGHDSFAINTQGERQQDSLLVDWYKRDFSSHELVMSKGGVRLGTRMIRNIPVYLEAPELNMVENLDHFMLSLLGHHGGSHHHDDIRSSAYRQHSGGVWSQLSKRGQTEMLLNTWFWMYRYYRRIGHDACARRYWQRYLGAVFSCARFGDLVREGLISGLRLRSVKWRLHQMVCAWRPARKA